MTKISKGRKRRVCQGDIFRDVPFIEWAAEKSGVIEISEIIFPLCVVLTQDCDLNQDYRVRWARKSTRDEDKKLFSVIVAPLYNIEHFYKGEHLSALNMKMAEINKKRTPGTNLRNNESPRYHYLDFPDEIRIVNSVVDFKHYFTVNVEFLKKHMRSKFVCRLAPLFREDLSNRFAAFLSRIGLPDT